MTKYRKFLVALGGAAAILSSTLSDGVIASNEIESVVLALVSAGFVWLAPNG